MPQFRPQPAWEDGETHEQTEEKESAEALIKEVPENQPGVVSETLLSPPTSATGSMPILLLTGSHPTFDGEALAAYTARLRSSSHNATSNATSNTGRFAVIPADPKLRHKRASASISTPPTSRPKIRNGVSAISWKTLIVFCFLIAFLIVGLVSRVYFLNDSPSLSSRAGNIPCQNGCYASFQSNPFTIRSHLPTNGKSSSQSNAHPAPSSIASGWKLTFDEEFSEAGINWNLWQDGGRNWGSGGNGEEQAYLASECTLSNGVLRIRAENIPANGKQFSSCMLNTQGTFSQTYGYFEFRGKLPSGQGFWPAFWMYETASGGAPEIDVMENLGSDIRTYYMTYHSDAGKQTQTYHGVDLAAAFHTYAVKWLPHSITYYFDDVAQFTVTNNIYNNPMFILVNLAVGGTWPGSPDASTPFPGYFNVDYIRAYAMP